MMLKDKIFIIYIIVFFPVHTVDGILMICTDADCGEIPCSHLNDHRHGCIRTASVWIPLCSPTWSVL